MHLVAQSHWAYSFSSFNSVLPHHSFTVSHSSSNTFTSTFLLYLAQWCSGTVLMCCSAGVLPRLSPNCATVAHRWEESGHTSQHKWYKEIISRWWAIRSIATFLCKPAPNGSVSACMKCSSSQSALEQCPPCRCPAPSWKRPSWRHKQSWNACAGHCCVVFCDVGTEYYQAEVGSCEQCTPGRTAIAAQQGGTKVNDPQVLTLSAVCIDTWCSPVVCCVKCKKGTKGQRASNGRQMVMRKWARSMCAVPTTKDSLASSIWWIVHYSTYSISCWLSEWSLNASSKRSGHFSKNWCLI